jgi:hypothetical protein
MLLFEEDLQARQDISVCFLKAQALLGLGKIEEGRALLQQVYQLDHAHTGAIDLLQSLRE